MRTNLFNNFKKKLQIYFSFRVKTVDENKAKNSTIDIISMDFQKPNKVQSTYNEWVSRNTKGLIRDQSLQLDSNSKMVLSSVMSFKADWLFSFSNVEPGLFYVDGGKPVEVDMMTIQLKKYHYGYLSNNNGEWLSIPYNSTDAMLILLPNKTKSFTINDFVQETPTSDITDIINIITEKNRPSTFVNITLPKFKIDNEIDLKEALLKVKKIFQFLITTKNNSSYFNSSILKPFLRMIQNLNH